MEPIRKDSDFQVLGESETFPEHTPPTLSEIPHRLYVLEKAFAGHRTNHRLDEEQEREEYKEFHDKLEKRLRSLEDWRLYGVAVAGSLWALVVFIAMVVAIISGVLKWGH